MTDLPRSRVRVAHVIATLDDAGAERQMTRLVSRLDPSRFCPAVFTLVRGGDRLEGVLADNGVPHRCLFKRRKGSLSVLLRLRRLLRQEAPQIVHTWLFTSNTYGRIAALLAEVPHIVASERAEDPWKGPLHRLADRALARRTDAIVANSRAVADAVRERVAPFGRIKVIYNGVEVSPSPPVPREELGAREGDVLCLFAGRLEPQKNVSMLLKSFRKACQNRPELLLLVAGEGPLDEELRALARGLRIETRVRFLGYRKDLHGLMRSADFLILPSLWEGMSNVLLEAMLLGLPVVASRIPSISEFVEENSEGLLFEPGSLEEISHAIERAAGSEELLRQYAARARFRAERYDVSAMVSEYENLYLQLARSSERFGRDRDRS